MVDNKTGRARYLDEAGFGTRSNGAGYRFTVTQAILIARQPRFERLGSNNKLDVPLRMLVAFLSSFAYYAVLLVVILIIQDIENAAT